MRDKTVDILKGFAILLMVMGHFLAAATSHLDGGEPHNGWLVGQWIDLLLPYAIVLLPNRILERKGSIFVAQFWMQSAAKSTNTIDARSCLYAYWILVYRWMGDGVVSKGAIPIDGCVCVCALFCREV